MEANIMVIGLKVEEMGTEKRKHISLEKKKRSHFLIAIYSTTNTIFTTITDLLETPLADGLIAPKYYCELKITLETGEIMQRMVLE